MIRRQAWLTSFMVLTFVLALIPVRVMRSQTADSRFTCPLTQASEPQFTPTGVQPETSKSSFYHGTKKLAVLLVHPWYQYQTKIPWFSDDAKFPNPVSLTVSGRRLDGDAQPPEFLGANIAQAQDRQGRPGISFITSSMKFPAAGCWEITARMNNTELKFVTSVIPGQP